ncbi:hypothetical protein LLOABG_LLOABG_05930, partial [Dysosmobacter welbionis]
CLRRPSAHGDLQCFGLPCQGQAHHQLEPVVPDPGVQGAAIALRDFPHPGDAEAVGGLVRLGSCKIRLHRAAQGVLHPQHEESLVRLAADGDSPFPGAPAALDGVVQSVAQQGAQIHIRHRQVPGQEDGEVCGDSLPLHGLRLGGEDGIGRLVFTEPSGSPQGRGTGYLVQIADGPLFISLLQKTPDRRQVIPQIVAETAHLGL